MATYAYQQNFYEGASVGYVKYNTEPALGTPLAAGEKMTISGEIYSRNYAVGVLALRLSPAGSSNCVSLDYSVAAKKGVATTFSIIVESPIEQSFFPTGRTVALNMVFSVLRSDMSGDVLTPTTTQQFVWLRYRINPVITKADFFRYGIDSSTGLYKQADDGVYCMSASFKISLASGYSASDITVAKITSASHGTTITIPQSALTSALTSAGYIELTGPSLFSGMTFATNTQHVLTIEIGDAYDVQIGTVVLPRAFANLCLSNVSTGGICFGGFPKSTENNPMLESYYPAHFYSGIEGVTNYTSGEVKTGGKWIDGKDIYRFVFKGTTSISGAQAVVATLPSNTGVMITLRGMVNTSEGWRPIPNNYYGSSNWNCNIYQAGTDITLGFGSSWKGARDVIIIAEYTKVS